MSYPVPLALGDVQLLVQNYLAHTRPVGTAELNQAINYGIGEVVRTCNAVNARPFQSYVDPFTISANVLEYDVSALTPRMERPVKLICGVPPSTQRIIRFQYRDLQSEDFEQAELSAAGSFGVLLYDLLEGMLPGVQPVTTSGSTATSLAVASVTGAALGNLVLVPGAGTTQGLQGPPTGQTVPTDYYGTIIGIGGASLTVSPQMTVPPGSGVTTTVFRRQVLRIVPAIGDAVSGRLWYQYRPDRLVNAGDLIDPISTKHVDLVVAYAVAALKAAVNDTDAAYWRRWADDLRIELYQDIDPSSYGNTNSLNSGLVDVADY